MAKTKTTSNQRQSSANATQPDSVYLLKIVLFTIIGTQWLHLTTANGTSMPIPVGLFIGVFFAMHDHFKIDRKIEYAVLIVAMLIGFYSQVGVFLHIS